MARIISNKKKKTFLQIITNKPCNKCLIQACCSDDCDSLYEWFRKYNMLFELNDIVVLLLGTTFLLLLELFVKIKIVDKERSFFYLDKMKDEMERRLYFR